MNGKRTLDPSKDLFSSNEDISMIKYKCKSLKKNGSVGSLSALIKRTPSLKKIRTRNAITKDSGLFTKEYNTVNPVYKHKTFVNIEEMKQKGGYAGNTFNHNKSMNINNQSCLKKQKPSHIGMSRK